MTEVATRKYQHTCPFVKRNGQECGSRCINQLCSKHLKTKSASKYVTEDYLSEVLAAINLKKPTVATPAVTPAVTPTARVNTPRQPSKLKQQQSVCEDDSDESSGPTETAEVPTVIKKPRGRPPKPRTEPTPTTPVLSKKVSRVAAPARLSIILTTVCERASR